MDTISRDLDSAIINVNETKNSVKKAVLPQKVENKNTFLLGPDEIFYKDNNVKHLSITSAYKHRCQVQFLCLVVLKIAS